MEISFRCVSLFWLCGTSKLESVFTITALTSSVYIFSVLPCWLWISESSLLCCVLCHPWAIKPIEEGALQMVLSTKASHKWDLDQKWSSVQSFVVVLPPLSCAPLGRLMNRWENMQGFCIGKTVKILLSEWSSACLSPPTCFFSCHTDHCNLYYKDLSDRKYIGDWNST